MRNETMLKSSEKPAMLSSIKNDPYKVNPFVPWVTKHINLCTQGGDILVEFWKYAKSVHHK